MFGSDPVLTKILFENYELCLIIIKGITSNPEDVLESYILIMQCVHAQRELCVFIKSTVNFVSLALFLSLVKTM